MSIKSLIPIQEESFLKLRFDPVFSKISIENADAWAQEAWEIGLLTGEDFIRTIEASDLSDFKSSLYKRGLKVIELDTDCVYGDTRYCAEYQEKEKTITMFKKAVAIWAKNNTCDYIQAETFILLHEFFHHLECASIGHVSRIHTVYMLKFFGMELGQTGIASLSEIAADAFASIVLPAIFKKDKQ